MLDAALQNQLKTYLENVREPIELVPSSDDSAKSREMAELLAEIAALSDKVSVAAEEANERSPSFAIRRTGTDIALRFAGLPMGHEFTSLVLALLHVGGHKPKTPEDVLDQVRALDGDYHFETYFSLSCQNCPDVVQALNLMSVVNPRIRHTAIDGGSFKQEVEDRKVMAVPSVYLNGEPFGQGRMELEQILAKLDTGSEAKAAEKLSAKEPYEVLIVGGGPAGAAAGVYAARKGIRTGIVAERFGGQVLDTMGIENFTSIKYTEGPKLGAELEEHVRHNEVDLMNLQRAEELIPAAEEGGYHELRLKNGASLKARAIILSTGARWRQLGVPGEEEYRNKGVAYCPHCDGPLFKGKPVAVIGGGNSGVEAAIDLAGIVKEVTLIEYDGSLRADEVLQRKLRSLKNVRIITSAMTTEVNGNGEKVTGLTYKDRDSGESHELTLDGIFVQIGLVPNTEWLQGTVALTQHGEIEVDAKGGTSVPGVYAGGDATTTPFKQIVIAMGEGARASLAAFDHLIRLPAGREKAA